MKALLAVLAALLLFGCSHANKEPPVALIEQDQNEDYAAIAFFDCDQMINVMFISFGGKFESIPVRGNAMLVDLQLRMSHIAYARVQYVQNQRPCGFTLPDVQ